MAGRSSNYRKKMKGNDPSYSKKKPLDFYPVQRKVQLDTGAESGTAGVIDVGKVLSQANRRLYRNGKMYSVKLHIDPEALPAGASVEVYTIRPTWTNIRAWELAKENFDQSYSDELENINKNSQARWFDFRVNHGLGTVVTFTPWADNNMDPAGGYPLTGGEFDLSIVEDQAGADRTFTWAGTATGTEYAILKEFSEGYRSTTSPSGTSGDGPYDNLHADSSQSESEALQAKGNNPPYALTIQTSSIWSKVGQLSMGASGGTFSTAYFDVPCGFIGIRLKGAGDASALNQSIVLEAQSGDYKGVKAHNMQRM